MLDDENTLTDERIEAAVAEVLATLQRAPRRAPAGLRGKTTMSDNDTPPNRVVLPTLETPTLTKAELADLLFERLGLNKRESKDMVEAFFDIIHGTLVTGDDVKLSGFGNFNIRRKAPRPGPQPAHRRGDPDQGAQRRHLSRQPQTQGSRARRHTDRGRVRVKSSFLLGSY